MKKILRSTVVLTAFAFSLLLVQLSCRKDVVAQIANYILPVASKTTLGGVMVDGTSITIDKEGKISSTPTIFAPQSPIASTTALGYVMVDGKTIVIDKDGKITAPDFTNFIYCKEHGTNDKPEIWIMNMDGSANRPIPIALPGGISIEPFDVGLKRTATKIIFGAENQNNRSIHYIYTCNLDGTGLTRMLEIEDDIIL